MKKINIDGQEYDIDSLPDAAKQQLKSLQFVDAELVRLNAQAAVFKTARIGYLIGLKQALNPQPTPEPAPVPEPAPTVFDNDTIKYS